MISKKGVYTKNCFMQNSKQSKDLKKKKKKKKG